ncbi:hypothetical protein FRC07_006033 [Ceratobasidium sp. 392]|nr:hypothetical protein FRC07_006033 [Ceratobasidium sp. 392]
MPSRAEELPFDTDIAQHLKISPEMDKMMSGEELFDRHIPFSADSSHTTEAEVVELAANNSRRSSSADPIDFIPTDKRTAAEERVHINVDDSDEDKVEAMFEPSRPKPSTPTGKTPFRQGHVLGMTEKIQQASRSPAKPTPAPPTLAAWLQSSSAATSMAKASVAPDKPSTSSKAVVISPGFTRPTAQSINEPTANPSTKPAAKSSAKSAASLPTKPTTNPATKQRVSKSMKPKSGLKIHTIGSQSKNAATSSESPGHKPQVDQSGSRPKGFEITVEEWYCASAKHGTGKTRHKFRCDSKNIVTVGHDKSESLTIMMSDFEYFEVAEGSNNTIIGEEFLLALIFTVTEKFAHSPTWHKCEDTNSRLLVKFDTSDGIDEKYWRQCVDHLAKSIKKSILTIDAMQNLLEYRRREANSLLPLSKKQPRPKPAKSDQSNYSETAPPEVPQAMFGPSTRTRARALPKPSKDEPHRTQPVQPPLQDPDEIMLVYPQSGAGAVNINRAELLRLEDGEFLNDTLIELGLKLWINKLRIKDPELADQIHVFNSFFFKKLDGGRGKVCDYNSVKKWTSKFDLFKKKFVIVPINEHLHWYLAVVCFPEHVLRAPAPQPAPQPTRKTRSSDAGATKGDEPRPSPESDVPNTEHNSVLDVDAGSPLELGQMEVDKDLAERSQSMAIEDVEMVPVSPEIGVNVDTRPAEPPGTPPVLDMTNDDLPGETQDNANAGKHGRTIRILREYLQAEAQERHGKLVETKDSKLSGGLIEDKHLPVPEQPNWCDCGVYLLHYVEAFVANPLELLALPSPRRKSSPEEIAHYDKLWRKEELEEKRKDFRNTVNDLSSEWLKSKSKAVQAPQDGPPTTEGPMPGARRTSPPPNVGGELSIVEIDPPSAGASLKEPATPTPTREPLRTGTLPVLPSDIRSSSPNNHGLLPPAYQDEEVNILDTPSPGNESSVSAHKRTRRRTKGGERHTNPSWNSKGTQVTSISSVSSPEL